MDRNAEKSTNEYLHLVRWAGLSQQREDLHWCCHDDGSWWARREGMDDHVTTSVEEVRYGRSWM